MSPTDPTIAWLRRARMHSQLLVDPTPVERQIDDVVSWFAAMQAQDLAGAGWALGVRTGCTREEFLAALGTGRILRTWPMRGTLHLVPGSDARWLVEHFAQRSLTGAAGRRAALGLTMAEADRAADALGTWLSDGLPLSRARCLEHLAESGIAVDGQRGYHLLWHAAARGVICAGPPEGTTPTFVLLESWAPPGPTPDRAEALTLLATRFVRSHGPVDARDLARWADLPMAQAREALAGVPGLVTQIVAGRSLLVTEALLDQIGPADRAVARSAPPRALPGFDELVLGYRDRSAQLDPQFESAVVPGSNGMFLSTLVLDGRVVGTWRREERARNVRVLATPLAHIGARDRRRLEKALGGYGRYLGRPALVEWSDRTPDTAVPAPVTAPPRRAAG